MPFTGSHPAAVLPLLGAPLPASALVIGSMAPDLPYYEPWITGPTHSAVGILTIDLLLGAIVWTVWHGLLAAPALAAAPRVIRERVAHQVHLGLLGRVRTARAWLVALGLVVGSATHVGWDEFTHRGRWGARHVPVLARDWAGTPGWHWAQYASTVLGAVVLVLWLVRWLRRSSVRPVAAASWVRWAWPALAVTAAVTGCAAAVTSPTVRDALFTGATHGAAAAAVLGTAIALAWHATSPRRG